MGRHRRPVVSNCFACVVPTRRKRTAEACFGVLGLVRGVFAAVWSGHSVAPVSFFFPRTRVDCSQPRFDSDELSPFCEVGQARGVKPLTNNVVEMPSTWGH